MNPNPYVFDMTTVAPLHKITAEGSFAAFSFNQRYPAILDSFIHQYKDLNDLCQELQQLKDQLIHYPVGRIIHTDEELWSNFYELYENKKLGEVPFMYAEIYLFALINNIFTSWGIYHDPCEYIKEKDFEANQGLLESLTGAYLKNEYDLSKLIALSLESNTADLSQLTRIDSSSVTKLLDHTDQLISAVSATNSIHIVLDNSGPELLADLFLSHHLCHAYNKKVTMHFKAEPIFVSDSTEIDLWNLLDRLDSELAYLVNQEVESEKLHFQLSHFWNSPKDFDQYSEDLRDVFASDSLLIVKGDANYRRVFQDRKYDISTPCSDICNYIVGKAFAIRTLKSEILLGYNNAVPTHPDWLYSGKYGIIQQLT